MFNIPGRLIAVLMSLAVITATILPGVSFANSDVEGTQVLKDDENQRVVISNVDGIVTKATFEKDTNTLIIDEEGKGEISLDLEEISEELVAEEVISPDEIKTSGLPLTEASPSKYSDAPLKASAATSKQNTWINYEYTITHSSPEKWQLRRPNGDSLVKYYYKNVTRKSSNASNLSKFQDAVENIDYYEWKAIGSSLTSLGMSWLAFILSVPTAGSGTLTAGLAALGAYGVALDSLIKLHSNTNVARTYYFRV
ncbi:hypothetical protein FZC84_22720 [Rossellomorea vietnamensis]|uniref:Uncharacterized protein n=1 Tax=Rossellomorea vietnamensis TaxID=218284 RepID=A0A5D4LY93_9BACI|nr:geobacillin-26 family protein [Rossellomorea vietnamensis]TYR94167.1 hypothetical protein FZC84_22720 [Rossellomorea vietnamensis]